LRGGRARELHEESSFTSERDAESNALRLGQHWVDKRLRLKQGLVLFFFLVGLALVFGEFFFIVANVDVDVPKELPAGPN
jgi:hypothetical protein